MTTALATMGFLSKLGLYTTGTAGVAGAAWYAYSRNTTFVPFSDSLYGPAAKLNPHHNPPVCIDEAVRTVPLSKLKYTSQDELTKEFCRGIWGGWGFAYQRSYLDKKYRYLDGRQDHLWDKGDLLKSDYALGTKITDHFEVVDRSDKRVVVRCGGSPMDQGLRPGDGIFSMEVDTDPAKEEVMFHLKSVFFNSTPEGGRAKLPWWFDFAHKQYTKLW